MRPRRQSSRSPALWVMAGMVVAGAIAAAGLTLAAFPFADDPPEDERTEYAFAYTGWALALIVAGLAAWIASSSIPRRLAVFAVTAVVAAVLSLVLYFEISARIACQEYQQCIFN